MPTMVERYGTKKGLSNGCYNVSDWIDVWMVDEPIAIVISSGNGLIKTNILGDCIFGNDLTYLILGSCDNNQKIHTVYNKNKHLFVGHVAKTWLAGAKRAFDRYACHLLIGLIERATKPSFLCKLKSNARELVNERFGDSSEAIFGGELFNVGAWSTRFRVGINAVLEQYQYKVDDLNDVNDRVNRGNRKLEDVELEIKRQKNELQQLESECKARRESLWGIEEVITEKQKFLHMIKKEILHTGLSDLERYGTINDKIRGEFKNEKWDNYGPVWKRFRSRILYRDNWSCRRCRTDDESAGITGHHTSDPRYDPEQALVPENVHAFCDECHKKVTDEGRRVSNRIRKEKRDD